jgi:hypothetical protein
MVTRHFEIFWRVSGDDVPTIIIALVSEFILDSEFIMDESGTMLQASGLMQPCSQAMLGHARPCS